MHQPDSSQETNSAATNSINLSDFLTDPNLNPTSATTKPNPAPATNSNNTQEPAEEMNPELEQEEVFDPDSIVRDIVKDDINGRNLTLQERYEWEKTNLIGTQIQTAAGLTWTIRHDIEPSEVEDDYDSLVGIKNFDFSKKRVKSNERGLMRINFLDLLIHLWPGDWRAQLTNLNHRVHQEYKQKVRTTRHG